MRKLIAAINMTIDGFCDHTAMIADDEILQHYTALLNSSATVIYGRITYQLMGFWPTLLKNPSGNKSFDEYAIAIDNIPKIVYSNTMNSFEWKTATLAKGDLKDEILNLKSQSGKDILVGSRSLIVALTQLGLIDEYQLCVHPVLVGNGLALFKDINNKTILKLLKTKSFTSGAIILYYDPTGR
jgi:dihydrofolate reductase